MTGTLRTLARLLGPSRRWLAISAALAIVQSALLVPGGLLVRHAFDASIPAGDTRAVGLVGAALVVLAGLSVLVGLLARGLVLTATEDAIRGLRVQLVERLIERPLGWFDGVEEDVVHSTVVQDTERLDLVSNAVGAQLLPAGIVSLALLVAAGLIAPLLTGVLVAMLPLVVLAGRLPARGLPQRTRAYQRAFDAFSVRVQFALRAALEIRADGAQPRERDGAAHAAAALADSHRRLFWLHYAVTQSGGLATTVTGVAVLVAGGIAVAADAMTLGSLLAFYALVAALRGQLQTVLVAAPAIVSGVESLARLEALLDGDASPPEGGREIAFTGALEVSGIGFAYPGGPPVLEDASLSVAPGEIVGLAGPSGSGKTTLVALMLGLREPASGTLTADGVPFRELDLRALRRRIGMVPQQPLLFEGTVADNVAFAIAGAGPEELDEAARLAGADAFVRALPAGWQTRVGDRGKRLSGGQVQRLVLARALLRRPALLVLDEPTSHLDPAAEAAFLDALRTLSWRPAIVVISHDEQLLAGTDRVYRLEGGRLPASR